MTNNPNMIKNKLMSIIKEMGKSPESFVENPGEDLSRNRKLKFDDMIQLLLSMNGNNLLKNF